MSDLHYYIVTVDKNKVQAVNGKVYRIEKMKPFDDKKFATIQTVITKL